MWSFVAGKAAKAGVALLTGLIGAPAAVIGAEFIGGSQTELTITGYIVVGALGGAINWANVYFKRNHGYPPRPGVDY